MKVKMRLRKFYSLRALALIIGITLLLPFFASAQEGVLVVGVEQDCKIKVADGDSVAIKAGELKRFNLAAGAHWIGASNGIFAKEEGVQVLADTKVYYKVKFDPKRDSIKRKVYTPKIRQAPRFVFGGGGESIDGRGLLKLADPFVPPGSNWEGTLEFRFCVKADGSVSEVDTLEPTDKTELKEAGIKAIKKWQFSPLEGDEDQWIRVKITFKPLD